MHDNKHIGEKKENIVKINTHFSWHYARVKAYLLYIIPLIYDILFEGIEIDKKKCIFIFKKKIKIKT